MKNQELNDNKIKLQEFNTFKNSILDKIQQDYIEKEQHEQILKTAREQNNIEK